MGDVTILHASTLRRRAQVGNEASITSEDEHSDDGDDGEDWDDTRRFEADMINLDDATACTKAMSMLLRPELVSPDIYACRGGCDRAWYCSPACADHDWIYGGHCLLCLGGGQPVPSTVSTPPTPTWLRSAAAPSTTSPPPPPWMQHLDPDGQPRPQHVNKLKTYVEHCYSYNETLLLAGQVVCGTMARAMADVTDEKDQREDFSPNVKRAKVLKSSSTKPTPTPLIDRIRVALAPFRFAHKGMWWDQVALPPDVAEEVDNGHPAAEEDFRAMMGRLAFDSAKYLKDILWMLPRDAQKLVDGYLIGALMSLFELNNLELQIRPSPTTTTSNTNYISNVRGTAFYGLHSCINHSCDPTLMVDWGDQRGEADATAVLRVLAPVPSGTELTVSYIDMDDDYDVYERQETLADYGFVCHCHLCKEQRKEGHRGADRPTRDAPR